MEKALPIEMFKKHLNKWWLALILGILGIVLGVRMLSNPVNTFAAMSTLFIIFFIGYGIIETISVIVNRKEIPAWGWDLIIAIVPVILGIVIWVMPIGSELLLATFFAIGMIFIGINHILGAISMSKIKATGWVISLILGILVTLLGFSLLTSPLSSALVVGFLAGFAFLFAGIDFIAMAIVMSKAKGELDRVEKK